MRTPPYTAHSTFVEKALKLAAPDIDTMILEQRKKDLHYAKELTSILEDCMDEDGDHVISIDEFKLHMADPRVRKFFQARDLDMKDAELFFRMLASVQDPEGKSGDVDIRTFVLGCMRLRGMASNIDVQSLHYDIKNLFRQERNEIQKLVEIIQEHLPITSENHGYSIARLLPVPCDSLQTSQPANISSISISPLPCDDVQKLESANFCCSSSSCSSSSFSTCLTFQDDEDVISTCSSFLLVS